MHDVIDELGKHVPMEPRRSYPVVIVAPERIAALQAEVARLREALNHVEWASPPSPAVCVPFCPWCGRHEVNGHRFDCMRQGVLEPTP